MQESNEAGTAVTQVSYSRAKVSNEQQIRAERRKKEEEEEDGRSLIERRSERGEQRE